MIFKFGTAIGALVMTASPVILNTSQTWAESALKQGQRYTIEENLDDYYSISVKVLKNRKVRKSLGKVGCNEGDMESSVSVKSVEASSVTKSALSSISINIGVGASTPFTTLKTDLEFKLEDIRLREAGEIIETIIGTGQVTVERDLCFNKEIFATFDIRSLQVDANAYNFTGDGEDAKFDITTRENYNLLIVATHTTACAPAKCQIKDALRNALGTVSDSGELWLTIKNKRHEYRLPVRYDKNWKIFDIFPMIPDDDEKDLLLSTDGKRP